jgi:hypothetical protein
VVPDSQVLSTISPNENDPNDAQQEKVVALVGELATAAKCHEVHSSTPSHTNHTSRRYEYTTMASYMIKRYIYRPGGIGRRHQHGYQSADQPALV